MNLFGIHPVPWSASDRKLWYRFEITEPLASVAKCPTVPGQMPSGICLQFLAHPPNYMKTGNY